MRNSLTWGLILFGDILIYGGNGKTQSVLGELSRAFPDGYSKETWACLIGRGLLLIAGPGMLAGGRKGETDSRLKIQIVTVKVQLSRHKKTGHPETLALQAGPVF